MTPLYPEVGHDLGLDAGALGTLVGVGGVMSLVVQVPGGSGGDRWGRRPFFAVAMLLLVMSQLARWRADAPATLLAAQILGGVAQGIATVNAWALVADAAETSAIRQGQSFGVLNGTLALGLIAGYLLAGGIGTLIGWRPMSLFLACLPLLVLPGLRWIPPRRQPGRATRPGVKTVLRAIAQPRRLTLATMAALTLAAGQGATYLLPFAVEQRQAGPFTAALLLVPYVVGSVVVAPLGGRLSDQFGTRPVIVALLVVGVISAVTLVWGAGIGVVLIVCFALIGASVNGALPLLAVRVLELRDASGLGAGTIMAGLRMGQSSGTFIGPAIAGLVLAHAGLVAGWLTQAGALALSLALHELVARERHPRAPAPAPVPPPVA